MTSDATRLIVPDKQLARLDYPKIVVPEYRGRLFFFGEANVPCFPYLNLIESLWKHMRDNITRNHFYLSFKELCEALVERKH